MDYEFSYNRNIIPRKKLSSDIFKLNNLTHTFFAGMANDGKKLNVFFHMIPGII